MVEMIYTTQPQAPTTTDTYQYYGKQYSITVDQDGKGIDVQDYKGKEANKQKLLDNYNENPNVDPQNGKPFRAPTASPVASLKPTTMSDSRIFEYDGVSIDAGFILGSEQKEALTKAIDHVLGKSGDVGFTVQGSAGTGKTTIIGLLHKYMEKRDRNQDFFYFSPTHAANVNLAMANLKNGVLEYPKTVQSSIGKEKFLDQYIDVFKKEIRPKFGSVVYIIDEVSMMTENDILLWKELAVKQKNTKIIFLGDPAQIPPVEGAVKRLSSAFNTPNKMVLNKVYRQNPNDHLELVTKIRNNSSFKTYNVLNSDGSIEYLSDEAYEEAMIKDFMENPEETIYIAYRRRTVQDMNTQLKKQVTGSEFIQVGDKIVGESGRIGKSPEINSLANSITYMIEDVEIMDTSFIMPDVPTKILKLTSRSKKLEFLREKGVDVEHLPTTTYVQLSMNDNIKVKGITKEELKGNLEYMSDNVKLYMKDIVRLSRKIKERYSHKLYAQKMGALESLAKRVTNKIDLGGTYIWNYQTEMLEPYDQVKHTALYPVETFGKTMINDLLIGKGLDYGYAITAHKSQGMTIENVYADVKDTQDAKKDAFGNEIKTYIYDGKNNIVNTEKNTLYYVMMTRASKKVMVNKTGLTFDETFVGKGQEENLELRQTQSSKELQGEYPELWNFYSQLTESEKEILTTLGMDNFGSVVDKFEEDSFIDSEAKFIEKLKCNF